MFDKKRGISSQHNFHFILDLYFLSTLENIEIQFTLNILLLTFISFSRKQVFILVLLLVVKACNISGVIVERIF